MDDHCPVNIDHCWELLDEAPSASPSLMICLLCLTLRPIGEARADQRQTQDRHLIAA